MRSDIYPAGLDGPLNLSEPRRFWILALVATLPQLAVGYVYSDAPPIFIALLMFWNIAPFVVALILFLAGARAAAWGWLIAVALWGCWAVIAVVPSESSTAALGFMWAPAWSFTIVGPLGAGMAILRAKRREQ